MWSGVVGVGCDVQGFVLIPEGILTVVCGTRQVPASDIEGASHGQTPSVLSCRMKAAGWEFVHIPFSRG